MTVAVGSVSANVIRWCRCSGSPGRQRTAALLRLRLTARSCMALLLTLPCWDAVTAVTGSSVNTLDISTSAGATAAITSLDLAIAEVGAERAKLGAFQNRLEHTVSNLSSMIENTSAARSRIQDADFAVESANLAKNQVMQQAGTAMLAQANASSQGVLSLLK